MNNAFKQLLQWPPTPTTVIGAGMLIGVGCYWLTGSVEGAVAIAGAFKMLCPQDGAAADKVLGEIKDIPAALGDKPAA